MTAANPDAPLILPLGLRITLAACAMLACGLCVWQIFRHFERNEGREAAVLVADTPPLGAGDRAGADTLWRVVRWEGRYVDAPALMSSRKLKETLGYGVLRVFETTSGQRVLVDLGWVPPEEVAKHIRPEATPATLTGQLRPVTGRADTSAIDGHGTKIWPYGATRAAAPAMGAEPEVYVMSGAIDGAATRQAPEPVDGFARVPPRDDTSAHYASQWFAIAVIAGVFSSTTAMNRLRLFARHRFVG